MTSDSTADGDRPDDVAVDELVPDRFAVRDVVGSGPHSTTYRAVDRGTDREVALKVLEFDEVDDWKSVELFERQIEALQNIDHPDIPAYIDASHDLEQGGAICLAQEFIEGTDLGCVLDRGETYDEGRARDFVREVLEILVYLQEFSPPIVHRDIKPSNIIRRPNGRLALSDFGAVRTVAARAKGGSTFFGSGTNGYMAPEQLHGHAGPAADVYATAATAVHLLSGRPPLELPVDRRRLRFRHVVDVSEKFGVILERMLEPDPERRFDDARGALDALRSGIARDERVDGADRLSHPERKPEEIRSRVDIEADRMTIELAPFGGRWAALASSGLDALGALSTFAAPLAVGIVTGLLHGNPLGQIALQVGILVWFVRALGPIYEATEAEDNFFFADIVGADSRSLVATFAALATLYPIIFRAPEMFSVSWFGAIDDLSFGLGVFPVVGILMVHLFPAAWLAWIVLSLVIRAGLDDPLGTFEWGSVENVAKCFGMLLVPFFGAIALMGAVVDIVRKVADLLGFQLEQIGRVLRPRRERLVMTPQFVRREIRSGRGEWREDWGLETERLRGVESVTEETTYGWPLRRHLQISTDDGARRFGRESQYVQGPIWRRVREQWADKSATVRDVGWQRELDWLALEVESRIDCADPRES